MKTTNMVRLMVVLSAFFLWSTIYPVETAVAGSEDLDQASVQAYLEKEIGKDTGSCLVDNMKLDIIGIADIVPGHQAEVFYDYEFVLRCNRGKDTKTGQGVLKAVRLRDGNWIDRETVAIISK